MNITKKGSRWLKFDFHTHTPASNDFGRGSDAARDIESAEWLRAAMEAQLDCVVVCDHNSGEWIDILQSENERLRVEKVHPHWYRDLTIFPGVEIACDANQTRIHIIGVFDPKVDTQAISEVLGVCGVAREHFGDSQGATIKSFSEVAKIIKAHEGIAIAAHIDREAGLLYGVPTLRPSIQSSLESLDAVELCDPSVLDTYHEALRRKLEQIPHIAGSDAHTLGEIGKYYSWIRMGTPSIAALRLAFMEYRYSVLNQEEDPNRVPDLFLSRLSITDMTVCGRIQDAPLLMELHPHFNAIIGGRGSGKSTILESIRIATRQDQHLEDTAPKSAQALKQFMSLGTDSRRGVMLETTHLSVELQRRSIPYRLHWRYDGTGPTVEKLSQGSSWEEVAEPGKIPERFQVLVYSQKQINELAANPNGLLEFIDRNLDSDKSEWDSRYEQSRNEFLELKTKLKTLIARLAEEEPLRANLQDLKNDLKSYEEGGHKDILLLYQKRRQQRGALPAEDIFDQFSEKISSIAEEIVLSDLPDTLFSPHDPLDREMIELHEQTSAALDGVVESLENAQEQVAVIKRVWKDSIRQSGWFSAFKESEKAYTKLETEYASKQSSFSLAQYADWTRRRDMVLARLQELEGVKREVGVVNKSIEQALQTLRAFHNELFLHRKNFIDRVLEDNQYVRMELVQFGDTSKIEEQFRSILGLEEHLFSSAVYDSSTQEGILARFIRWEDQGVKEEQLPSLIEEIKNEVRSIAMGKRSLYHRTFDIRLMNLYENNPGAFDELDAWWPEDLLRVKYPTEENTGRFEALEKGSEGQRAAAILAFLLSYGEYPLIIDQPEDDLDNALIYDLIVKQIHENKMRRQLIIVTHNPNIVVNGDADLVHVMKFKNGQITIAAQGDLGDREIRNQVCTIMEGGREAFVKRYKRVTLKDSYI